MGSRRGVGIDGLEKTVGCVIQACLDRGVGGYIVFRRSSLHIFPFKSRGWESELFSWNPYFIVGYTAMQTLSGTKLWLFHPVLPFERVFFSLAANVFHHSLSCVVALGTGEA